jgi:ABC-type phosphate transport system auxiliary subunit
MSADILATTPGWFGVGAAAILTAPATVAAIAGFRNRKKLGDVQTSVDDANTQLRNGHSTNLRDDLSEALLMMKDVKQGVHELQNNDIRLIRQDISRISGDISVLRAELTVERDARTDIELRLDDLGLG